MAALMLSQNNINDWSKLPYIEPITLNEWIIRLNSSTKPLLESEQYILACPYLKEIREVSIHNNFSPMCIHTIERACKKTCVCYNLNQKYIEKQKHILSDWIGRLSDQTELTDYENKVVNSCDFLKDIRDHYVFNNFSMYSMLKTFIFHEDTCICGCYSLSPPLFK